MNLLATCTAIIREGSNAPIKIGYGSRSFGSVPTGRVIIILSYFTIVIVMCFYKLNPKDSAMFEDIGYRTGFIAIAQIPLLFLLAGKNNIIGFFTGIGYERLNWLHRWTARILWLTVVIHLAFWFNDWAQYDYIKQKIQEDPITRKGLAAFAILTWIVISSFAPIRKLSYEVFVIQHLVSFAGFIAAVLIHTPNEVHVWIWIPVGLFFFDRLTRAAIVLYTNCSLFHKRSTGFWACKAEFTALSNHTTKVTIYNPPISWKAGQHVFLSCHSIVPLQSHPFTIASLPEDGRMDFLIRSHGGGTKRMFSHASKHHLLPTTSTEARMGKAVAIEGPYGHMRPLQQFDTVVLISGSTGATFTMPLMRSIVSEMKNKAAAVTRKIRYVWVIKSGAQVAWFAQEMSSVLYDAASLKGADGKDLNVEISLYVTCDDGFTNDRKSSSSQSSIGAEDHGRLEVVSSKDQDEKAAAAKRQEEKFDVKEVVDEKTGGNMCGGDRCCCAEVVEDEDEIIESSAGQACCCGKGASVEPTHKANKAASVKSGDSSTIAGDKGALNYSTTAVSSTNSSKDVGELHPGIHILSGRPNCRNIIRKELERAYGESAVVVCGPRGMVDGVRGDVVGLSDERAVHKGTGAQGVSSPGLCHWLCHNREYSLTILTDLSSHGMFRLLSRRKGYLAFILGITYIRI
jgi:predicted ferric reductase